MVGIILLKVFNAFFTSQLLPCPLLFVSLQGKTRNSAINILRPMAIIERKRYLDRLIRLRDNGQVKIITGIRRCGKSFLLNTIYRDYLMRDGVKKEQIIMLDLDDNLNARYRNPMELSKYLRALVTEKDKRYYILIDEIQKVKPVSNPYLPEEEIGFVDVLNGLKNLPNADVYVTGSNSKMLSSDIGNRIPWTWRHHPAIPPHVQ